MLARSSGDRGGVKAQISKTAETLACIKANRKAQARRAVKSCQERKGN